MQSKSKQLETVLESFQKWAKKQNWIARESDGADSATKAGIIEVYTETENGWAISGNVQWLALFSAIGEYGMIRGADFGMQPSVDHI